MRSHIDLLWPDAIRVKIRDEGMVRNKAIHIALAPEAITAVFPETVVQT